MMALIFLAAQAAAPSAQAAHPPRLQNQAELFEVADYPKASVSKKETGIVSVVVAVGVDGAVTSCQVTESSGHPVLDAQTCAVLQQRAKFEPARDAGNSAVAGEFRFATAWAGPKAGADLSKVTQVMKLTVGKVPPDYKSPITATVTFDGAGKATACEITTSSGSVPADDGVCAFLKGRTIAAPIAGTTPVVAVRYFNASMATADAGAPAG